MMRNTFPQIPPQKATFPLTVLILLLSTYHRKFIKELFSLSQIEPWAAQGRIQFSFSCTFLQTSLPKIVRDNEARHWDICYSYNSFTKND